MTCAGDNGDCPKPVEKAGLCAGHRKRKNKNLPINAPLRTYGPWTTLMEAVKAWGDEADDRAFDRRAKDGRSRVEERISKAAIRYAEAAKKRRKNSGSEPLR